MTALARNKEKQPGLWRPLEDEVDKDRPAEDTAQHVLRGLLQPVAQGVLELLVPGQVQQVVDRGGDHWCMSWRAPWAPWAPLGLMFQDPGQNPGGLVSFGDSGPKVGRPCQCRGIVTYSVHCDILCAL